MQYYLGKNGQQSGPYQYNQLLSAGITPDTMVWREGMDKWVPAKDLPELSNLFTNPQEIAPNPYGFNNQGSVAPIAHYNWMPLAIVGTVTGALFSCMGMIFGIIGIIYANKANQFFNMSRAEEGARANSTAKVMTIISLVVACAGLVFLLCGGVNMILNGYR